MFNSDFLFIMLLAFKHTHLIPDYDVFLCIFLDLLSLCPPIVFFDNPPCPTSLNIILFKPLATAPDSPSARTAAPFPLRCRPSLKYSSSFPTKLSHMSTYPTSSSLQSRSTIPLTAILFEFLYPWILFPHTGNIPDKMICPNLACFVFFSSFLYFSTIAVVPSLSVLFVPTCTHHIVSAMALSHRTYPSFSMVPPFPLPMIFSTLSVTCSILAPGKHTTTSSPLLSLESVFRMIESPT